MTTSGETSRTQRFITLNEYWKNMAKQGVRKHITPYEVQEFMRMVEVDGWGVDKIAKNFHWSSYFCTQMKELIWNGFEHESVYDIKAYCEENNLR